MRILLIAHAEKGIINSINNQDASVIKYLNKENK